MSLDPSLTVAGAGPGTNLDLYENTVWLIIITMTTVGYGGLCTRICDTTIEMEEMNC